MSEQQVFGAVCKAIRKQMKLQQQQVAERAGISASALSRIEAGEANPCLTSIVGLAKALGLSSYDLMYVFVQAMAALEANQVNMREVLDSITIPGEAKAAFSKAVTAQICCEVVVRCG